MDITEYIMPFQGTRKLKIGGVDRKLALKEKAKSIAANKKISRLEGMSSVRYTALLSFCIRCSCYMILFLNSIIDV